MPYGKSSGTIWCDLDGGEQASDLTKAQTGVPVVVKGKNRLVASNLMGGSIAMFPPPHSFYWARETEQNLGYGWYRKEDAGTFSMGVRQAEIEENPEFYHNSALYSARPGTWQRMPMFLYVSPNPGMGAIQAALSFTHGDRFKPLSGYKIMGEHYHVGLVERLKELGGFNKKLNDIETMKQVGIDIYGVIDGVRGPGRHDNGELFLKDLAEYYAAAKSQSDTDFLVMPNDENSTGGRPPFLGGHYEMIPS